MNKKIPTVAFAMFLMLAALGFQPASAKEQTINIKRLDHHIDLTFGMPETSDPAWAYDTASAEMIWNIYGTLYGFDGEKFPLEDAEGNIVDVEWDIATEGKITDGGLTYTFKIRSGVIPWHDSDGESGMSEPLSYGTVTAEDVEFSIERGMVLDHAGGPYWMLFEPLLGIMTSKQYDLTNVAQVEELGHKIDDAVTVSGDYVTFHLHSSYAPFMQILGQTWASVVCKQWIRDLYAAGRTTCWPGWDITGYVNWRNFNDRYAPMKKAPTDTPDTAMLGSGPYEYEKWISMKEWRVVRFADYWEGWPSPHVAGYVERVTVKNVEDWPTRRMMFEAGDGDTCAVPRAYVSQMDPAPSGIRGMKDFPTLIMGSLHFNYDVAATSSWIPKLGGVDKVDLLSDIHMRKALAQCLDFATYYPTAWAGEAKQPRGPIIEGLEGYWPGAPIWSYSLAEAEKEFKLAHGGQAWANGFELTILYNTGNEQRRILVEMIEEAVETGITGWGTLPEIIPLAQSWSIIIPAMYHYELPAWNIGWLADFAHAHNFVVPYVHPFGDFAMFQKVQYGQSGHTQQAMFGGVEGVVIDNDYVISMIGTAVTLPFSGTGGAEDAQAWYNEIQIIFKEDIPTLPGYQGLGRHFERDWVQGYYYNSLAMGALGYYFRFLFKGLDAEISGDQTIDVSESSKISAHWYDPPYKVGPDGYNRKADVKPVNELNSTFYKIYGADWIIDSEDAGLVNKQWLDKAVGV